MEKGRFLAGKSLESEYCRSSKFQGKRVSYHKTLSSMQGAIPKAIRLISGEVGALH